MQRFQSIFVFFFGTPRRMLYSVVALLVTCAVVAPLVISWAIGRILLAISPLITLVVVCAIGFGAFRLMFGGVKLPKEKKKDG